MEIAFGYTFFSLNWLINTSPENSAKFIEKINFDAVAVSPGVIQMEQVLSLSCFEATQAWISSSSHPIARKPIRTFLGKDGSKRGDLGLVLSNIAERERPIISTQA